jgi:tetratricopeptide (TPR) repeat protein
MKIGHLLFPALFFLVLIFGAFWIMRTVENSINVSSSQTVYLESSNTILEVTAQSVGSTREKAHQAFVRFADSLVKNDALSLEEVENLNQILQLGEGHWSEENWAPAFYAFDRVLKDLGPLIDEGLGYEKATEMEARYNEASQSLTNEIILVESSYLDAIESANHGYNDLLAKDWISAIQSFAKAVDTLNLVKAQAAEIVAVKVRNAYSEFEAGKLEDSAKLFNEVLVIHPDQEEAITGLQLIKAEEDYGTPVLEAELVESNFEGTEMSNTLIPTPEEIQGKWEKSEHPTVVEADRHFDRRELKESLALYVELRAKEPSIPGLDERISLNRKVLRNEELIRLMDKGAILVELGQWTGAIKTYRHILNVDPVHKEARRGWEEALVSLVAQEQVEQYKDLIRHHLNARQFSHAGDVLVEARNVLHDRPDFDQLFLTVSSELANQQTPVDLVIGSDGETWVSIPGKMAPERFTEKESNYSGAQDCGSSG